MSKNNDRLRFVLKSVKATWGKEEKTLIIYSPYYYFFESQCRDGLNNEELDFHQIAYPEIGYDALVDIIISDWELYKIGMNENYVQGMCWCAAVPIVFSTEKERMSFRSMIKEVLERKIETKILKQDPGECGTEWVMDIKYKQEHENYCAVSSVCKKLNIKMALIEEKINFELGYDNKRYGNKQYNIKFLFKVFPSEDFCVNFIKFYFAYNRYYFAQKENEYFDYTNIFLWNEKFDEDAFYTVGCAIEDWFHLQMIKHPDYTLGREYQYKHHICTKKMYEDLEKLIMDIMLKKFDKNYIMNYDNVPKCYLVDIDFIWSKKKCQATKINIEDILNKKEPNFDKLGIPREKLLSCYTKDLICPISS